MSITTLFRTWGKMQRERAEACPWENEMIQVPFAFEIGEQSLPAGQYRIEMLTESKPGKDEIEIIAFREAGTHLQVSFLAFLERGDAENLELKFRREGRRSELTEIQVAGKRFRLAPSRFAEEIIENEGTYQTIRAEDGEIWQAAR